jgi:hypothetical protein
VSHGQFESVAEARLTATHNEFLSVFEHDMRLAQRSG